MCNIILMYLKNVMWNESIMPESEGHILYDLSHPKKENTIGTEIRSVFSRSGKGDCLQKCVKKIFSDNANLSYLDCGVKLLYNFVKIRRTVYPKRIAFY